MEVATFLLVVVNTVATIALWLNEWNKERSRYSAQQPTRRRTPGNRRGGRDARR